ncbi:TonB-dependent receptor [Sapientia aquatica]|uniref:TonB-dependent receptor n=1 Tax=Sapientia aquatica TaxID=1549640 RepID=A0A4R5VYA4_9BURK|nr:TonB-dependent receptor [Sapientia aquatica]TDK64417.1 TonB-dependent receptor [Sapientia aquatica]
MQRHYKFVLSNITIAILALSNQAHAQDQSANPAALSKSADSQAEVQQIVVTGSAQGRGIRKIDAPYSITTASEEQIKEANPLSTADLFKIVPGVYAETSGGQTGPNIEVAGFPGGGDAPYVTIQLNGAPIYPAPTLSFMDNSSLFRLDDTIDHMEALVSGPNTVLSNGQPGATMNFVLKTGENGDEGLFRATVGTGNERRYDGFLGGKISEGWYATIGGFYRTDEGVRNSQFPTDDGYQLTGTLTHKLDEGKITIYGRTVNDKNLFFTAIPVTANSAGVPTGAFPGFNPLTGSLYGNETRFFTLQTGPGQSQNIDMSNGRGINLHTFGVDFTQKISGWDVSNKLNFVSGDVQTNAFFTGGVPQTMNSYIANAITNANKNTAAVAAGGLATTGSATYSDGSGTVAGNQQVLDAGAWYVDKQIRSTTDELKFSKELIKDHTFTFGTFLANYSSHDIWYLGNSTLMTATTNPKTINVALNNGAIISNKGNDGPTFYSVNDSYTGQKTAFFVADQWKINPALTLDAGLRSERQTINATLENISSQNIDTNPLHLYNQNTSVLNGTYQSVQQNDNATSFTVGAGYKLDKDLNIYARINSGHLMPQFDDIRGDAGSSVTAPVQGIHTYEVGIKSVGPVLSLYGSVFHKVFTGIQDSQILSSGQTIWYNYGSVTNGALFEGAWRPLTNLQLAFSGDYEDGKYSGFQGIDSSIGHSDNGNQLQRQPKFQARLTPSYRVPMDWGSIKLYSTYSYIGQRYSDIQNQQVLPAYHTLDGGIVAEVGDKLEFRVSGTNLTNTFGLTEGDNRILGTTSGVVMARPIFGRAIEASVAYRF